ncbi:MAG: tRNA dihydrouridine synthase DusB [Candidatus Pacearchaeota archaeon]|jgi:nifR3 family TIM-barrel protein
MTKEFLKLAGKLVLAPMHDITNIAFRVMCKRYGASLVSTELLSANAIARENNAVMNLAQTCKEEKPVVCQIFSNNTENMIKSAKILEKNFDVIDINLGCPSDKILKQGSGGALLKRKNKIGEIVKQISSSIKIPLSVKIRSGFDEKSINAVEIAKICKENGASIITIHGRTVKQGYSGNADWNIIKKIKDNVDIIVIGNGDIFCGSDAKKMLEETGCDYVMIGRGAIGNPFIFKEINEYLRTGKIIKQTKEEKIKDYFEYIELAREFNIFSIKDAKLRAQEFTKGLPGSSKLRLKLNRVKTFEEIENLIRKLSNS